MEPARPAPPRAGPCPAGKENRAGTGHGGQLSGSSPPRGRDGDLSGSWPPAGVCGPTGTAPPCSSALALRPSGAKPGLLARPAQVPRPPAPPWPDKDERCLLAGLWGSPPGASLRPYRVVRETGELPPRNPLSGLATFQTEPERGGTSHPPSSALRPGLPRPGTMTAEDQDSAALPEEGLPAEVTPCPFVGHRGKRVPYAAQSHVGRQDGRLQDPAQTGRGTQTPGGRARPRPRLASVCPSPSRLCRWPPPLSPAVPSECGGP